MENKTENTRKESIFIQMDKKWNNLKDKKKKSKEFYKKFRKKFFNIQYAFYALAVISALIIFIVLLGWNVLWLIIPLGLLLSGKISKDVPPFDERSIQ